MKVWGLFCAVSFLALAVESVPFLHQDTSPLFEEYDDDGYVDYLRRWENVLTQIRDDEDAWEEYLESIPDQQYWDFDDIDPVPVMNCPVYESPTPPTSVHQLRPSDVSVFGALGDSITAGNGLGAKVLVGVAIENRGEAFTVGGDYSLEKGVLSIPNILRHFNPNIKGHSTCATQEKDPRSGLNVAQPGARAGSLPGQARNLVAKIRNMTNIDINNDWKMISIFVGGNDLCQYCKDRARYSPDEYKRYFQEALDYFHTHLPRTFVNVITMFDTTPLHNMSTGIPCDLMHLGFCYCAINETLKQEQRPVQMEYYYKTKELIDSGRYDAKEDFTVVLQHHMRDTVPILDAEGNIDHSYLSPDCFHPSRKGHHGFAYSLWNTLLVPVGQKTFAYDPYETPVFTCPTPENPYFFTNRNSPSQPPASAPTSTMVSYSLLVITLLFSFFTFK